MFQNKRRRNIIIIIVSIILFCCLCLFITSLLPETTEDQADTPQATQEPIATEEESPPTDTPKPTNTLAPTRPLPTATQPPPTNTPTRIPPSSTPIPPSPTPVPPSPTAPPPSPVPTQPPQPTAAPTQPPQPSSAQVIIVAVNKGSEYVDIQNIGGTAQDLSGWVLFSEKGSQSCTLGGILDPGQVLRIWAMAADAGQGGYNCGFGSDIWNNSEPDPAILYDANGNEVSRR